MRGPPQQRIESPDEDRRDRLLEAGAVALATLIALALRAWHLGDAGIAQFDEGVYALSGLGLSDPSQPHRLFPGQERFSPPVYISLVALSFLLGGATDRGAILVNVILGTLTIPVLWWVARRWFGPGAGVAAAIMLALNESHVTLSRSALTDVTFALVFLLAVAGLMWALDEGGTRRAVVAGVLTGLAWNTKYHGWFAGLIAIGAVVTLLPRDGWNATWQRLRWLLIAAVVALVLVLPWTLYIGSQPGSVGGWSNYFSTMLRVDWVGNLVTHVQQQQFLEGPWSRSAVPLAILAVCGIRWRTFPAFRLLAGVVVATGAVSLILGEFAVTCALALAAAAQLWRTGDTASRMLLLWLALWCAAAPLYEPYFRLLLPFQMATYVAAGAAVVSLLSRQTDASVHRAPGMLAAGLTCALVAFLARSMPDASDPWSRGDALRRAAGQLGSHIPPGTAVTVVGEPALAFYLHQDGHPAFRRPSLEDLRAMRGPAYLVAGVYAIRAPRLRDALASHGAQLQPVARIAVDPGDLRLLDDGRARLARAYRSQSASTYDLTLYFLAEASRDSR
ncbi:MAG TPA: glycosyltransferase family 39 protein [Gemmatimonadaceae bacterium]